MVLSGFARIHNDILLPVDSGLSFDEVGYRTSTSGRKRNCRYGLDFYETISDIPSECSGFFVEVNTTRSIHGQHSGEWLTNMYNIVRLCHGIYVDSNVTTYISNGLLSRNSEEPAVLSHDREEYWVEGKVVTRTDDRPGINNLYKKVWYLDGEIHRENDMPAIVLPTESYWYKNGVQHRDGGMPAVTGINLKYFINGLQVFMDGDKGHIWFNRNGDMKHVLACVLTLPSIENFNETSIIQ